MLSVIVLTAPFVVPGLWGWKSYGILTGSMEPAYGVNSLVYVEACEWDELRAGDVVTYRIDGASAPVMTHRIIRIGEGWVITKGDANEAEDPLPVSGERILGRVRAAIPGIYPLGELLQSDRGKWGMAALFLLAGLLWGIGDRLAKNKTESKSESKTESNVHRRKIQNHALMAVGGLLMIGALVYLGVVLRGYMRSRQIYDALEERVLEDTLALPAAGTEGEMMLSEAPEKPEQEKGREPDWADRAEHMGTALRKLAEENGDLVGWISFEGLDMEYPVMQGEDDEEYLYHTFWGEYNRGGSIFMEAQNTGDWNDFHTIVYGHNMRNGSMFGRLKELGKPEVYENNRFFTVYTVQGAYRYEIFAMYDIEAGGDIYNISPATTEERGELIAGMQKRSFLQTGVAVGTADRIVTLSTCSATGRRFVVNARCTEIKSL